MSDAETPELAAVPTGTLMAGKRGLIMGVANDRSIAWGIARAVAAQGAELAFTYQGEALEKRVRPLAESVGAASCCPATSPTMPAWTRPSPRSRQEWGGLDFLVHAIGFADKQYPARPLPGHAARRPSCRRWTSPATPSSRSRSARCR